jgi:hypothetical protein
MASGDHLKFSDTKIGSRVHVSDIMIAVILAAAVAFRAPPMPSAFARSFAPVKAINPVAAARLVSMTTTPQKVGIVGATGAVGKEVIGVLAKRGYPMSSLRLFGSERSAGTEVSTSMGAVKIEPFSVDAARETEVLFLCVDGSFALEHGAALSAPGGPLVIDNSSAFRRDPLVPLIVPEINAHTGKGQRLIANPNCTTAILLMALAPLVKLLGIKRLIVSTYQAASGAGAEGMAELQEGLKAGVEGKPVINKVSTARRAPRLLALGACDWWLPRWIAVPVPVGPAPVPVGLASVPAGIVTLFCSRRARGVSAGLQPNLMGARAPKGSLSSRRVCLE